MTLFDILQDTAGVREKVPSKNAPPPPPLPSESGSLPEKCPQENWCPENLSFTGKMPTGKMQTKT